MFCHAVCPLAVSLASAMHPLQSFTLISANFITHLKYQFSNCCQVVEITGWLSLKWKNELAYWDPDQYGGVETLLFEIEDNLWIPDIGNSQVYLTASMPFFYIGKSSKNRLFCHFFLVFLNQLTPGNPMRDLQIPLNMSSSGTTYSTQPLVAAFYCEMNANKFPFDSHQCRLTLTSGVHPTRLLMITQPNGLSIFTN